MIYPDIGIVTLTKYIQILGALHTAAIQAWDKNLKPKYELNLVSLHYVVEPRKPMNEFDTCR